MKIETQIKLNKFVPRNYQRPLFEAIENDGIKRAVLVWHRRAGKDVAAWNLIIRMALKTVGAYYYILPTYRQARLILFEGMTMTGQRFMDYIPEELISKINIQEMKISLINGSLIYFLGSDNFDSLRGSNPKGIVFSEYAFQHPSTYPTLRPILVANDGWCVFISTPFGENHFYKLYEVARTSSDWFCDIKTIDDTNVVSAEQIETEEQEGLMSRDMIEQEYFCSFTTGATGSYYAKYLNNMELNNQIGVVPWEPSFSVYTAWDLGVRDSTVILFFQIISKTVNIIDSYSNDSKGLEHYASVIAEKPYKYAKHFAPHDIMVREFSSGMSRMDKARELGIEFEIRTDKNARRSAVPNVSIMDGIEAVRSTLPRIWIDKEKCKDLISSIRDYRKEYDSRNKIYKNRPLHDSNSHYCFTADTLVLTRYGMCPIIDIEDNDYVMTLKGWQPCTRAYKITTNAKLVEVTFQDGTKVKCTPDHRFLTENGWKSARFLQKGSRIQSSLIKQPNYLMRKRIGYRQVQGILESGRSFFIGKFGLKHLVQFLNNIIFIIKMESLSTTTYGILSAYQYQNTWQCLSQTIKEFLTKHEKQLQNGMDHLKVENGIVSLLKKQEIGKSGSEKLFHVNFAEKTLNRLSELGQQGENSVMQTAKLLLVESVLEMKETADVYDIGVPGVGHFALSNGAIVHNCDALRYLCLSLSLCRRGTTPEELERRYQESMNPQGSIPSVFQNPRGF